MWSGTESAILDFLFYFIFFGFLCVECAFDGAAARSNTDAISRSCGTAVSGQFGKEFCYLLVTSFLFFNCILNVLVKDVWIMLL